ncbi:MAG: type II toxin-antitoxin system VapC family toxin [Chloroflexi bacterium]|nr:type II toxin-antitoxin system VapC family toxin [Chloroflexota bacterium]
MAAARRPRVYDTSVYVNAIRSRQRRTLQEMAGAAAGLSMVVVFELLAGADTSSERTEVLRMVEIYRRQDRLLVPSVEDWTRAGVIIANYARQHGALKPRDHLADILITLAAARMSGEIVTVNLVDFRRWARMLRRAGGDVLVSDRV